MHGRVIWALRLDTVHEGQAYLWRAHCETARHGTGGSIAEWIFYGDGMCSTLYLHLDEAKR